MGLYEYNTIGKRVKVFGYCNIYNRSVIGDDCKIGSYTEISGACIGNAVTIAAMCFIPEGVTIKDGAWIGPRVTFCNDKYPPKGVWEDTIVGTKAVIGAGAVILPGIEIGNNAIIGSGSVVTKSVPAGETWAGNPAIKLR